MKVMLHTEKNGRITRCTFDRMNIPFRTDEYAGFLPYLILNGKRVDIPMERESENRFAGSYGNVAFWMEYECKDELTLHFVAENRNIVAFKPKTLGLCSGIDCYMEKYPDWNHTFFPTLLRCEKSHFWGYNEMPDQTILAFASEEPVASWSNCYNELEGGEDDCQYLNGGHRIYTWNVHLLNCEPKPERHPLVDGLKPWEKKEWTFHFRLVDCLEKVPEQIVSMSKAPMLQFPVYTLEQGQEFEGQVWNAEKLWLQTPDEREKELEASENGSFIVKDTEKTGYYRVRAVAENGKEAEALLYVRRKSSWYLAKGREAVLSNRPLHTHHVEAFNSLYTIELARKYLPEADMDGELEKDFRRITDLLYDSERQMAAENPWRIQDSAAMCSLFGLRYTITKDPEDLRKAGHLADFLMRCQGEDGAYYSIRSEEDRTHYTAVTYIAKYVMDLARVEEEAAKELPEAAEFMAAAVRHRASAERAVEELVRNRDNIDTEGELTFEDGMISCSTLQIADQALKMEEGKRKQEYIQAAEEMYRSHECLTQKLIPDCRMNGGTLRFWEAQYNLHIFHNMMNSPCGWTCWKIYATWYLYQLTGKKKYLLDTMNAMGACLQLVDGETGKLRWGFICDPYVETLRYVQAEEGKLRGKLVNDIIGEQYVDLVSPWHRTEVFPRKKWAIDNLVHEVFKCLEEVGLHNACIYEEENGTLLTFNCKAVRSEDKLVVEPTDPLVHRIHFNLQNKTKVRVKNWEQEYDCRFGWQEKK